jgi:hypothetical protein
MRQIGEYFNRSIPEVDHLNEESFIAVLNQAGLTDQVAT